MTEVQRCGHWHRQQAVVSVLLQLLHRLPWMINLQQAFLFSPNLNPSCAQQMHLDRLSLPTPPFLSIHLHLRACPSPYHHHHHPSARNLKLRLRHPSIFFLPAPCHFFTPYHCVLACIYVCLVCSSCPFLLPVLWSGQPCRLSPHRPLVKIQTSAISEPLHPYQPVFEHHLTPNGVYVCEERD